MVVRALGYKNVVETAGTWPTNYMTKAVELGLLKDVVGSIGGSTGVTRGNSIMILWNMLRCQMWVVQSENATTGVTYGKSTKNVDGKEVPQSMLNIKFPNYEYTKNMTFLGWSYEVEKDEGIVKIEIIDTAKVEELEGGFNEPEDLDVLFGDGTTYEYAKNDFYTLIPGTEVEVLINKEDKEILSIVPTEDNVLVEGSREDLEKDYLTAMGYMKTKLGEVVYGDVSYAYLLLSVDKKSADLLGFYELYEDYSMYVKNVEEKTNYTKLTITDGEDDYSPKITEENELDALIIFGDERITPYDLEVGDIITWVGEGVFVLCRDSEDGTFESLTEEETSKGDYRYFIELSGEEYDGLDTLTVVSTDEDDEEEFVYVDIPAIMVKDNDYLDQDATIYFNFVGEVVRMAFGVVDAVVILRGIDL